MFKELRNLVYDTTFKVTILKNKINIINYEEILIFESQTILIRTKEYLVKIKGEDLTINKLYNCELLIDGKIKTIEFRW